MRFRRDEVKVILDKKDIEVFQRVGEKLNKQLGGTVDFGNIR